MGFNRVSSAYPIDLSLYGVQNGLLRTTELQRKLSTGNNLQKPSDDPLGMNALLRSKLGLGKDQQFQRNLDNVISELSVNDNVLSEVSEVIIRARELAVQAANQTYGSSDLVAFQQEVDTLIDRTFQLANSTYQGKYIFAGFQTSQAAFSRAGQDVNYDGTPAANPFDREVEVAQGLLMTVNYNGDNVFGNTQVVAGAATGSGLFNSLTKLSLDLQNANYTEITNDIALLATDLETVTQVQSDVGARVNQAEALKQLNENRQINFSEQIAKIQEVDIPSVVSQLALRDNLYQASLASLSRILQPSLVNFLR